MTCRTTSTLLLLLAAAWLPLQAGGDDSQPATAETAPNADLVVTLEHLGGKIDTYGAEIERMELVLSWEGRLEQVHLITRSGSEADTHVWYNAGNLVSVRYHFAEITGKGKVAVRLMASPQAKDQGERRATEIAPLDPEDYR